MKKYFLVTYSNENRHGQIRNFTTVADNVVEDFEIRLEQQRQEASEGRYTDQNHCILNVMPISRAQMMRLGKLLNH